MGSEDWGDMANYCGSEDDNAGDPYPRHPDVPDDAFGQSIEFEFQLYAQLCREWEARNKGGD